MHSTLIIYATMAYLIHGRISSRQKIELDVLGPSEIKLLCSVSSAACPEYVGIILSFGGNYWGRYGHFVLFPIRVNNSVVVKPLTSCFTQHVHIMEAMIVTEYYEIAIARSSVILLQSFLKGTFDFMLQDSHQTESKDLINIRAIIKANDLLICIVIVCQ